jgi:hypothetical protein
VHTGAITVPAETRNAPILAQAENTALVAFPATNSPRAVFKNRTHDQRQYQEWKDFIPVIAKEAEIDKKFS